MKWQLAGYAAFMVLNASSLYADSTMGDEAFAVGDYATAFRIWQQSAEAGEVSSMTALGTLYDTGHGVPQNFAVALGWYRRAAEAGDVRAMFNVAVMNDSGRGTAVDRVEARAWYRMAAEKGDGRAAYNLATMYRDGDGVSRNPSIALTFFRIAAAAGIRAASTNLAALGAGAIARPVPVPLPAPTRQTTAATPSHMAEIARLQKATLARTELDPTSSKVLSQLFASQIDLATKGDALAAYNVGFAFEHGIGTPVSPIESYVFYIRASLSPEQTVKEAARRGASDVVQTLTPEQHAAARDRLMDKSP